MADDFQYDVFLSHSSKDKPIVRDIAERLRKDGLRVWFDEWNLKPGHNIQHEIDEGLEHSRVLVLCMSKDAFGSEWAHLEAGTFRFRDPLNKDLRFIPLRLDDAPIRASLAQFLYINWQPESRQEEYAKLREACRPPAKPVAAQVDGAGEETAKRAIQLGSRSEIWDYAFSPDAGRVITGSKDTTVRLWDLETGRSVRVFEGHTSGVCGVAWSVDGRRVLSASDDQTIRLWDVGRWQCVRSFNDHTASVRRVAWSADGHRFLSGSDDRTVRLWDVETGCCLRALGGHVSSVVSVAWSADERWALSGSTDNTVRMWDLETGRCLRVFEGHTGSVFSVAWRADAVQALSGSWDNTVRVWDIKTGSCLRVFEGHTSDVRIVAWGANQRLAISTSNDKTIRLWDVETGSCLRIIEGHASGLRSVAWTSDQCHVLSGDLGGGIRLWDLSKYLVDEHAPEAPAPALPPAPGQVQYTNAKVLLVGDTSAGKTGLSMRLALNDWKPSDSTIGAWATHWKLPPPPSPARFTPCRIPLSR